MFVGHLAVALAAKSRAPRVSLGTLVAATFALDLLWPVLVLAGVERLHIEPGITAWNPLAFDHYPWSHSLLMAAIWGVAAATAHRALRPGTGGSGLIGVVVVSHWVLDAVSHIPDLPIWPGGPLVGAGLWRSVPATFLVEGGLLLAGLAIYLRSTRTISRAGSLGFWTLVAFATTLWAVGPFSPLPPGPEAVAATGFALWVLVGWSWWSDRGRSPQARPA